MYAHIDNFAVDVATNAIIELGIAPHYIRRYWADRGSRVQVRSNPENGLIERRGYDLVDSFGTRWEVKSDRGWHVTGNVYVEKQALEHSKADMYLYLAGKGYVVRKTALCEAIEAAPELTPGGDRKAVLGLKLPLWQLQEMSEQVITL